MTIKVQIANSHDSKAIDRVYAAIDKMVAITPEWEGHGVVVEIGHETVIPQDIQWELREDLRFVVNRGLSNELTGTRFAA